MENISKSYQVLARRYRPTTFSELVGQDVLVQTLTNAIKTGRVAHAFIFTGIRGVGKTTTARILARALNCVGRENSTSDPCGTCPQCMAIGEDRHVDVIEVDAASRTGVDDVRELLEGVHYQPVFGRYKVYIIDEVHMLSKSAFNALLKTLEEPPSHVKFIFATTDIHKVPLTVLSRCQRFDLKRVGVEVLLPYFERLLTQEGLAFEKEAIALIAKAADGSVRDGQSLLEQAIAGASDRLIQEAFVKEMLGLGDRSQLIILLGKLFKGQIAEALVHVRKILEKSVSPRQILQELLELVHLTTKIKVSGGDSELSMVLSSDERAQCTALSGSLSMIVLIRAWQVLLKGIEEVTLGVLPESSLEMVLIRFAYLKSFLTETETEGQQQQPPSLEVRSKEQELPQSFQQLIELFRGKGEFLLADQLRTVPAIQSYTPGRVKIHVPLGVNTAFLKDVIRCLHEWTGVAWHFDYVEQGGGQTLAFQEESLKQASLEEGRRHPHVQEILKVFPGATVKS